jgi:hypothetical protein
MKIILKRKCALLRHPPLFFDCMFIWLRRAPLHVKLIRYYLISGNRVLCILNGIIKKSCIFRGLSNIHPI